MTVSEIKLATSSTDVRLALHGIRKRYPSVVANDGIDLTVGAGQIHAVLGENGAGKSTLVKTIYGVVQPDAGEIRWEGAPVVISSPAHAKRLGIGMVFQHFSLFETLTAVENIALGMPGRPDLDALASQIVTLSDRYGLPVDPRRPVHSMSVGERQRVEIIRSLLQNPRLLIMDEPTSVLAPQAVQRLFETLRQLAAEGCSILYISHKLDEIRDLCEVATILRGGKVTGVCDPRLETASNLARMMLGKEIPACLQDRPKTIREDRLTITNLSAKSDDPFGTGLNDINVTVRGGEIVGIAGISGNGQWELMAALSGELPVSDPAAIALCGVPVGALGPRERRKLGLCFVPEERLGRGAVPSLSLDENSLLTANAHPLVQGGLIRPAEVQGFTERCIATFDVKCAGHEATAKSLSGGNLQKFIVGREVLLRPKVLLVSHPTWGVDVGAAAFIRQSLVDLRNAGTAILVVSEELDELFEICDRIAVIAKGRLSPVKAASATDVRELGLAMTGLWPQEAAGSDSSEKESRLAH
jgi:simple sugar transport system ATP-binding protein